MNQLRHLSILLFSLSALTTPATAAPRKQACKVQPAFWWAGMKNPSLQILIRGDGVGRAGEVELSSSDIKVDSIVRPANPNYLLVYINTAAAKPQKFTITLSGQKRPLRLSYELRQREERKRETFSQEDVVYLLMPDRFANGNVKNDRLKWPTDTTPAYDDSRHGGDIAGMAAHLPYLQDLGVTAVWPTPLLVNDMPQGSYHGYAITDYYEIDPRFGSNSEYRAFVDSAHARGIKVIQDMVFNHCGTGNFLFRDLPDSTWFNYNSHYVQTNYKLSTLGDPYASASDSRLAQDGWFVSAMPDWNQRNPHVLRYLIQTSLWWIEYAGIDGIRQDTYPYIDSRAGAEWCREVEREYPGFNIVGEAWLNNNVGVARWQKGNRLSAPFDPALPTVMDFPLMSLLNSALDEPTNDWDRGLARIYDYLSQDGVYADPTHLLTFLDNHDTARFAQNATQASRIARYRQALALLLTLRGIPQIYYGDEIGMYADKSKGDGYMRKNFPGGFPGDKANAFTAAGRTALQAEYFDYARRLLRWRRDNPDIAAGSFTHFTPQNGTYVYSRRAAGGHTVTVVINGTDAPVSLNLARYASVLPKGEAFNVVTSRTEKVEKDMQLEAREVKILDFK